MFWNLCLNKASFTFIYTIWLFWLINFSSLVFMISKAIYTHFVSLKGAAKCGDIRNFILKHNTQKKPMLKLWFIPFKFLYIFMYLCLSFLSYLYMKINVYISLFYWKWIKTNSNSFVYYFHSFDLFLRFLI